MQTLTRGYRGLTVLMDLNLDRFLFVGALIVALLAGGYIGTL